MNYLGINMKDNATWPIKKLVEDVHYYLEDGLMVLLKTIISHEEIVVAVPVVIALMIT